MNKALQSYRSIILHEKGIEVLDFIEQYVQLDDRSTVLLLDTSSAINLKSVCIYNEFCDGDIHTIINIKRLNDIQFVNKFLEEANKFLVKGGLFIGLVETSQNRKEKILRKFWRPLNHLFYFFDFIVKRFFPKFRLTKKIYFFLTKGKNRVISEMESYGRLYSCGFELVDSKEIDGKLWIVGRKRAEPVFNMDASYGPLIRLKRYGKNNNLINVYKLRTMYPYAEYLQEYIASKHGLEKGGKFKDDPRVTTAGRLFRKIWLDEFPMFINVLKGEMKLIGVRPLSSHYLGLYPEKIRELRAKTKPGLLPPFYADLPETLEQIIASEETYILSYLKNPILTDFKYFFKAVYNIVIKKARSK